MATLKNTTISGTGYFAPPATSVGARLGTYTSIIQWTNTGSQAYSVLAGPTPTLTNTSWTAPTGVTSIEVLVVAGGGSGGTGNNSTSASADAAGGGGAGGLIYNAQYAVTPGSSYTVTVGAGGAAVVATANTVGSAGSNSVFGTLTAIGGGRGVYPNIAGGDGGSGGGGGGGGVIVSGGSGTAGQGFAGGRKYSAAAPYSGLGGGGAGGKGGDYVYNGFNGGGGGPGLNFNISGTPTWYAGGGGGGAGGSAGNYKGGAGGLGGGGKGGDNTATAPGSGSEGIAGSHGTGGGGGGSSNSGYTSGAGGSGVVIIKYTVYSNNTSVPGTARYVTNIRTLESAEGAGEFKSSEPVRNYAGHNLVKYSDQLEMAPPSLAANSQSLHWVQFGSSLQTTAVLPPVIIDSPVTLNPLDYNGSPTFSSNNLVFTDDGSSGWNNCRATVGVSSGKWYWEYQSVVDTGVMCASIMGKTAPLGYLPGQADNYGVTYYSSGSIYKETGSGGAAYGSGFGVSDVIGIALDMDNGKVYFSKNGVWQNSGNPAAGTGAGSTSLLTYDSVYYPAAGTYYAGSIASFNFGNNFKYTPPVGFTPYSQARSVTKLKSPASGTSYGLINVGWQANVAFTVGKTYTFSIFAKAAEWPRLGIRLYDGSVAYFMRSTVDLSTGTQVTDPGNVAGTTTVVPYGNGWYRVIVTGVCTATGTGSISVECHNTSTVQNTETCNGSGIYVYGAQYEEAATAGPLTIAKTNVVPIPVTNNGYRIHTYTSTGPSSFTPAMSGTVEVLVVGGGGSGGRGYGGGGGAGGLVYNSAYQVVAGQEYPVVVGAGAAAVAGGQPDQIGNPGSYSRFGTIYALGGGAGGCENGSIIGGSGGSGGGGSYGTKGGPGTNGQGNKGGDGIGGGGHYPSAGGGGAGSAGSSPAAVTVGGYAGSGGNGLAYTISGTSTYYAGGGGGGAGYDSGGGLGGLAGLGGGGAGAGDGAAGGSGSTGTAGTANTGGGGGGGNGSNAATGAGGSGIVIVRYRYD